ncbi:TspO/MBR-related protein [Cylindrobasidium torrendii FP15055 ss-10]|uniref:TspO/MBR-related protein n=1 Tax=Cylindrobasidium torrendii FP15055 ss-10 TaxID=1314674 RepID=A0A0D7BUP6_9AGAR|nr:TspO/MBR-related protein [Cylindrobasidium torrendii FP15055 ss-10]
MSDFHLPTILLDIPRNSVTALGLPLVLGVFSGMGTRSVVRGPWYKNLVAPPGRPPRQVFPIVWPLLYLSMGWASHLAVGALDTAVLPATRSSLRLGLALYYTQLAFNFAWSPLFFNAKQVGFALVDSALLGATTWYMTSVLHEATNGQTTLFLAPYCAWTAFATYLNGGIWWLNSGKPKSEGKTL